MWRKGGVGLCGVRMREKGRGDTGEEGEEKRTNGGVKLGLVQVLDNGLDVLNSTIGLEVASDEEFAGLFIILLTSDSSP